MKEPEDEAFEELSLKQGHWQHTSGWRKKQILDITALNEALAEHAMQEVQRLGQEIEQEACEKMEKNAICSPFMISELWRLSK